MGVINYRGTVSDNWGYCTAIPDDKSRFDTLECQRPLSLKHRCRCDCHDATIHDNPMYSSLFETDT